MSTIETIKAKLDLVEEIGLVVTLQKSGKAFKGLCPFHNERTSSFYVFGETQTWHCFGCNEGGDLFTFVQKQQNLEFPEALAYLAEKAGVELETYGEHQNPEEQREVNATKERLRKLNEDATLWFHQMLLRSRDASEARKYVQSRGISSDTIITFSLGYAPDNWEGLSHFLLSQGYSERELVMGGLARERENDDFENRSTGVYDYFRNRIIFPIRDTRGRVIGFGGRALGDGKPKYLNSPQTLLFEKNTVLYAMDMARDAIKQAKQVIIVEGYVDAVIAHQYGTRQTVACIGSAITEKHIQQLKKLTKQVTLALDPDAAGSAATEQGIQEALKGFDRTLVPIPVAARDSRGRSGSSVRGMLRLEEQVDAVINVLQLPLGEDPDEVIRRDFSSWLYAVAHPLPLVDYYFVTKTAGLDLREPAGKTEAARRLLPIIGMISDRIQRDAYIKKLSQMIRGDERSLHEELQKVLRELSKKDTPVQLAPAIEVRFDDRTGNSRKDSRGRRTNPMQFQDQPGWLDAGGQGNTRTAQNTAGMLTSGLDRSATDKIKWEDYLIGLLLLNPGLFAHVCGIITVGDFAGTDTRELYHILNSREQRASSPSQQSFEQMVPSALLETVARVQRCVESASPKDSTRLVKAAVQCATRLKRTRLLQLNTELDYLIREATEAGDMQAVRQFQYQRLDIARQLRTIHSATHLHG